MSDDEKRALDAASERYVGPAGGRNTDFDSKFGLDDITCKGFRNALNQQLEELGLRGTILSEGESVSWIYWKSMLRKRGYDTESSESWDAYELVLNPPSPVPSSFGRFEASVTSLEESVIDKIAPHHRGGGILTLTGVVLAAGATRAVAATAKGVSGALKSILSEE